MSRRFVVTVAVVAAALLLSASCATQRDQVEVTSDTVTIEMHDSYFDPDQLTVERDKEVTFRFVNRGRSPHDAFIGDSEAQEEHAREMRSGDMDHDMHAGDDEGITVEPGRTGTITYRFREPGEVLIGCHQPGHYEVGMIVTINVR